MEFSEGKKEDGRLFGRRNGAALRIGETLKVDRGVWLMTVDGPPSLAGEAHRTKRTSLYTRNYPFRCLVS